jgi:hypothetical protein
MSSEDLWRGSERPEASSDSVDRAYIRQAASQDHLSVSELVAELRVLGQYCASCCRAYASFEVRRMYEELGLLLAEKALEIELRMNNSAESFKG